MINKRLDAARRAGVRRRLRNRTGASPEPETRTAARAEARAAAGAEAARRPEPEKPKPAPEKPKPVAEKVTFAADVLFDFDKAVIKPEGKSKLDDISNKVKGVNLEVVIAIGHADSIGSDAYNQRLSVRRAESVKAYLVSKGIEAQPRVHRGQGREAAGRRQQDRATAAPRTAAWRSRSSARASSNRLSLQQETPLRRGFSFLEWAMVNADPAELEKFSKLAHRWWDPAGRVPAAARDQPAAPGLDRAARGARGRARCSTSAAAAASSPRRWRGAARSVTGIDLSEKALRVAQLHLLESRLDVRLRKRCRRGLRRCPRRRVRRRHLHGAARARARARRAWSPPARACVRPGGQVFFSTINRNPKSYLFAVVGAEYVLRPAAQGHARLPALHQALRALALEPRGRPARRRADRHDLQPAHPALPPRARLRRELPAAHARAMPSRAVLFDFDGTLADTAPDLAAAVNRMRAEQGQEPLPLERLRPFASAGARGLVHAAFGVKPGDAEYEALREAFLDFYAERVCHETQALSRHRRAARASCARARSAGASSPTSRRASPSRSCSR